MSKKAGKKKVSKKTTRDPEATREGILNAAEAVFLEVGFGTASLSRIAERAGITKSLIHHYFGSKENLWTEVKSRAFIEYAEKHIDALQSARPSREMLTSTFKNYFDFLKENPRLVRILAWMYIEHDLARGVPRNKELVEILLPAIRLSQQSGELRNDVDARFILIGLIGLCYYWFQSRSYFIETFGTEGLEEAVDEAYFDAFHKIYFEGVLPR
jgi:TetR/AcrR family transcriptional regulator